MRLTLNITPTKILIGKRVLPMELAEQIAEHAVVVDNRQPNRLVVNIKLWLLPAKLLRKHWNVFTSRV